MMKKYFLQLFVMLGLYLTLLSNALANTVPHIYEQRTFQIQGKGNAIEIAKKQQRPSWAIWSRYEPTGIYIAQGQQLVINLSNDVPAFAYIQSYALYGAEYSWDETQFKLVQGDNTITAPKSGILYLANENSAGEVTMSVKGGSHFPVFEKDYHTRSDLAAMLDKYADAPYVEFVSNKGLVTATYKTISDYFFQKNATEPQLFLQRIDDIIAAQNRTAGYDNKPSVHQQDRHYMHMIQDTISSLYMYAHNHRTGYVNDAMSEILSGQDWGLYHELGHQHQLDPMLFHDMIEPSVIMFSLAANKVVGNTDNASQMAESYPDVFEYLNQPSQNKNFHNQRDHQLKVIMLHQLTLSLGEQFFPNLYRTYRETAREHIPAYGKDQIFMYLASKVSGYDLTKFFEMWGLPITNNTRIAIQQLNLNMLDKEIWKSTDTEPVIVPILKTAAKKISLTLSNEWLSNKRIVTFINGKYAFETHNQAAYYAKMNKPTSYSSTVEYVNDRVAYGDNVKVYLVPGKPGDAINLADSTLLASSIVGQVNITATENGVSGSMDLSLFNSNSRIIFFVNDRYIGESHQGTLYYMTSQIDNNRLAFNADMPLNNGDNVTVYKVPGGPGKQINLAKGTLLAATKFVTADKNQADYYNLSLSLTNSGFNVFLPKSLYYSNNRVVFSKNGDYLGEFKNGTIYYITANTSDPDAVVIGIDTKLNPRDVITVSIVGGSPGEPIEPYSIEAVLLNRIID